MRKNRIFTTTKNTKKFPISSVCSPPPSKNPGYATVVPLYSKWKVGASASVCRVTLCVYCWGHFVNIAKMYGNLFSGRPSKVLPWSWLKSLGLGLGLGTRSLGLGFGLEVQSLGLGLDKKVLFTSLNRSPPVESKKCIALYTKSPKSWIKKTNNNYIIYFVSPP